MKTAIGIILIFVSLVIAGVWIWNGVYANYQWENSVLSNWSLSDKASTISSKAEYIDKFIASLKGAELADNDALIYKTADNNCSNNVKAVTTLRDRLDQIKGMDESSFQYQQAITQITEQEQGQADKLLGTLNGCWMKANHYFLWNPLGGAAYIVLILLGIVVGGFLMPWDE